MRRGPGLPADAESARGAELGPGGGGRGEKGGASLSGAGSARVGQEARSRSACDLAENRAALVKAMAGLRIAMDRTRRGADDGRSGGLRLRRAGGGDSSGNRLEEKSV